jgi:hypothetical protein
LTRGKSIRRIGTGPISGGNIKHAILAELQAAGVVAAVGPGDDDEFAFRREGVGAVGLEAAPPGLATGASIVVNAGNLIWTKASREASCSSFCLARARSRSSEVKDLTSEEAAPFSFGSATREVPSGFNSL